MINLLVPGVLVSHRCCFRLPFSIRLRSLSQEDGMRGTSLLCRATRGANSLPWVLLMPDKPCLARGLCRAAALPGSAE